MRKWLIAGAIALIPTAAFAGTKTVKYPAKHCAEIVSQEYSTGGGETTWQILEILCKSAEGKYRGFTVKWGSAAGFIGLGRLSTVDVFVYVPYNGDKLKID